MSTPKVTTVPEPEPHPTMRLIPDAEPGHAEPEPTPEPGVENNPFAEPVPRWEEAFSKWKIGWEMHIYGMGGLFALLAIYSLISIVRLRNKRLLSRGYFVALNLVMLTMGVDRAIYLLVDAYNHKLIWPPWLAYMLIGLGFPCLTSAFAILYLALLQSTRTRLVPPKIQRPKFLAAVIFIHFTISIVSDVLVGSLSNAQLLLLVCQGAFLIWGIFLAISFMVIFRRLHKSSVRQYREIVRLNTTRRSMHLQGVTPFMKKPQNRWGNAIKVTLVTSLMGLVIAALQIYGASVVYGPFATGIPEAWPWWTYQFVFRVCEFVMCVLMSFVATQPFRYTADGKEKPCTVPFISGLHTVCCNTTDHELHDEGGKNQWNTNMFESAQLDSSGNPTSKAVSVGLDPMEEGNLKLSIKGSKENMEDIEYEPPQSPDMLTPLTLAEYHQNQNSNSNSDDKHVTSSGIKFSNGKGDTDTTNDKFPPTETACVHADNNSAVDTSITTNNSSSVRHQVPISETLESTHCNRSLTVTETDTPKCDPDHESMVHLLPASACKTDSGESDGRI